MTERSPETPVRAAVVQMRPAPLDLKRAIEQVAAATRDAADHGARLVAFGESFLGGYPAWLDHARGAARWDHAPTKAVFARMRASAIVVGSADSERLADIARECGVTLIVGANERIDDGPGYGTLFNALLGWTPDGELALHHRKLVPTYTERLVWGQGDAHGLRSASTPVGRVGGLICWEHWMPLARQALHDSGEDIHVAVWPAVNERHQLVSRHYALEGRCFVLAAGSILTGADLPAELRTQTSFGDAELVQRGGSAIIGPDGEYLAGPAFDEETILYADLDRAHLDRERMTLDVSGHYARPDVLSLVIDRRRRGPGDG